MEEPTRKITTRKADGDTVAALKRLLRESGVSVPEVGARDTTSADSGAGAGKNVSTTAGNNKKDGEGDTVASLKRLLKEAGATVDEGADSNGSGSADGADAGAGAAADQDTTTTVTTVTTKPSATTSSATEGSGTIADLKRLIQEAEDEKKKRDILISNQKKEMEDMKAKLEQVRLAKEGKASVPEKKKKKKKKKKANQIE